MAMRQVNLRLGEDELAAVDEMRGLVARNVWIRELVRDAIAAKGALRGDPLADVIERGASAPPALEDEAGRPVDAASVTGVRVEAGSMLEPGTDQGVSGAGQPGLPDGAAGVSGDRGAEPGQPARSVEADAEYVRRKAIAVTHAAGCRCLNCDYVGSVENG